MKVFRLHIRPKGGDASAAESFAYCRKHGVLGMGWGLDAEPGVEIGWDDYLEQAIARFGKKGISRVRYLHKHVREGDLIWTRDADGKYYVGRVLTPWRYRESPEAVAADIINVVECDVRPLERADQVPGKVVACFRPRRTIQEITDATSVRFSKLLWNRLADREVYALRPGRKDDLFDLLGSEATEDVIFLYLQTIGWLVVPGSRKGDTMGYEFTLVRPDDGRRAVVQVKTGGTPVRLDTWAGYEETAFVFQPKGHYQGTPSPNVVKISRDAVTAFLKNERDILPGSITIWLDYLNEHGTGLSASQPTA